MIELLKVVPWALTVFEKVRGYFKTHEEIKWVELRYPEKVGLDIKIKGEGYNLAWSKECKVPTHVEANGYEVVKVKEGKVLYTLKVKDTPENLVLLKKKD